MLALATYFVQIGIIVFPICVYQIWSFRRSFDHIPLRTLVMGLYGGVAAILCQLMPVKILGIYENFQCVPIILSILYGKRRAGLLSIVMLVGYQTLALKGHLSPLVFSVIAIVVYSAVPMLICVRFERWGKHRRFWTAMLLSVVTLVVELLFLVAYFTIVYGREGLTRLSHYYNMLGVACIVQLTLMAIAFFLLENIIENGQMRTRHESIIEYNPLGICAFDMDQRFTAVNPAYEVITGYTEAELLGKSRLDVWFDQDRAVADRVLREVQSGQVIKDFESVIQHKDGRQVMVRSTIVPMRVAHRIVGFFGMVTDITDAKVAEEALRNSEKLAVIGQLAAGVAHEIRNPLTAIKGFLQLLPSADDKERYIEIMKDELTRIELIAGELLVLAKPQAVKFSTRDIANKLRDVIYLLNAQAAMKSIRIDAVFDDNVPPVECEANQLKQVFLNIVKNAIEATEPSGIIAIELHALPDDRIIVRVKDSGPGIPEHLLSRLGEPFFTTKDSGTGLGLMMSKKIIADHHGELTIDSTVGEGTTVNVVVPCKHLQYDDQP